mgnify:CR=1 FL=1
MSLEKKSVHVRIPEDMLSRLKILSAFENNDVAEHAAYLLEKAIMGEYHVVSVQLERARRLGLAGIDGE